MRKPWGGERASPSHAGMEAGNPLVNNFLDVPYVRVKATGFVALSHSRIVSIHIFFAEIMRDCTMIDFTHHHLKEL